MARETQATVVYLRAPVRGSVHAGADPLPFAWSQRGRLQQSGSAPLAELAPMLGRSGRVVLLLAASDVTLLNLPVPPLPASRLQAALPALVEERIIGDPAACAIAAGPEVDGRRTIAVVDHGWLQSWIDALRQHGARRIVAQPMQLCLPLPAGHVSAALLENPGTPQLALRLSADNGIGLPVAVDDESQLADAVAELLATFAPGQAVQLSVPAIYAARFNARAQEHPDSDIDIIDEDWTAWIEGATRLELDLARGVAGGAPGIEWRRWCWPLSLAVACLMFNVIALNADWWRLRSEGVRLQEAMAALYLRTFPNEKQIVDPLVQMRQKVARARQSGGELVPDDFLALAAALGDAWGTVADPRAIAALDYRDGTLNLRLKPGAQVTLETIRPALAARRIEAAPSPADPAVWQIRSAR
jgi:general secretion pathway protein L